MPTTSSTDPGFDRIVDLLQPEAADALRQAISDGAPYYAPLLDETLAAFAIFGRQPPVTHPAALALMPAVAREQLHAYRLIDRGPGAAGRWTVTDAGREIAALLAAAIPPPTAEQQAAAAALRQTMLADLHAAVDAER